MKWYEIRIKTTEEAYDAVSEMLLSIGCGGVAIEDPFEIKRQIESPDTLDYADDEFIESLGSEVVIKAYFSNELSIIELKGLIEEKLGYISKFLEIGQGYCGYNEIDDEDWSHAWKKFYKPFKIAENIVIKPSWEDYSTSASEEIVIVMDPGMAFGTGTHETTKMCAQLLEEYCKPGDTVLDVGCGTGILSIICARLGADKITAVDIDDVAVKVTNENCILNGVMDKINAYRGGLHDIHKVQSDIVVANIIANVIIDITPHVPGYMKKDGIFIVSGVIRERRDEVVETCVRNGFSLIKELTLGEWVGIAFRCQDSL